MIKRKRYNTLTIVQREIFEAFGKNREIEAHKTVLLTYRHNARVYSLAPVSLYISFLKKSIKA